MHTHCTSPFVIKNACVDKAIQPIVQWLNGFDGIFTKWCCQGDYRNGREPEPIVGAYILFYCEDLLDLAKVCQELGSFGRVEVETYNGSLRYRLYFDQKQCRDEFTKYLRTKQ